MQSKVISNVQEALTLEKSGFLDETTSSAIKNFQMRVGLKPDGMLNEKTLSKLEAMTTFTSNDEVTDVAIGTYELDPLEEMLANYEDYDYSTDLFESLDVNIKNQFLDDGEFVREHTHKTTIFLHHTSGWENPYATIKWWNQDDRGRIGTAYVIGGINFKTGQTKYNGKIIRAFDDNYWAYHLGSYRRHKITPELVKGSIGIEICNFGWLTEKYGNFYTYTGQEVPRDHVIELDKEFRGYKFWHNYTDEQIESTRKLIRHLGSKFGINIAMGLKEKLMMSSWDKHEAFELDTELLNYNKPGVWSHSNVRKDKTDIYPHPKMIKMLENLYY